MKKTTNILAMSAAAMLLMASCTKEEVVQTNPGTPIRFSAFASGMTKGYAVSTYQNPPKDLKIYAFLQDKSDTTQYSSYFKATYNHDGRGGYYPASGGSYFWPSDKTSKLVFMGYSPAESLDTCFDSSSTTTPIVNSITDAQIINVAPKQLAKDQIDLLVFRTGAQSSSTSSNVPVYLQHALSAIEVYVANENWNNYQLLVKGVRIRTVGSGTLSLPTKAETDTVISQSYWEPNSTVYRDFYSSLPAQNAAILANNVPQIAYESSTGYFFLVPHQLTKWDGRANGGGSFIAVLCQINDLSTGKQLFPATEDKFGYAAVAISTNWEPGKKYKYTLRFFANGSGGAGTVPPEPTDPNPTDPDGEIIDPTPNPGDPVIGGSLYFNLQVNDWRSGVTDTPQYPGTSMDGRPVGPNPSTSTDQGA